MLCPEVSAPCHDLKALGFQETLGPYGCGFAAFQVLDLRDLISEPCFRDLRLDSQTLGLFTCKRTKLPQTKAKTPSPRLKVESTRLAQVNRKCVKERQEEVGRHPHKMQGCCLAVVRKQKQLHRKHLAPTSLKSERLLAATAKPMDYVSNLDEVQGSKHFHNLTEVPCVRLLS